MANPKPLLRPTVKTQKKGSKTRKLDANIFSGLLPTLFCKAQVSP
jgi:hypothetical protein